MMDPDLSRRVGRLMGLIARDISPGDRFSFVDRLAVVGGFSELQEADKAVILAAERAAAELRGQDVGT